MVFHMLLQLTWLLRHLLMQTTVLVRIVCLFVSCSPSHHYQQRVEFYSTFLHALFPPLRIFFYPISPSSGAALALSKYKAYLTMPSGDVWGLSLIHISEPTRLGMISYAVF